MSLLSLEHVRQLMLGLTLRGATMPQNTLSPFDLEREKSLYAKMGYLPTFSYHLEAPEISFQQQVESFQKTKNDLETLNKHLSFFLRLVGEDTITEKLNSFCPYVPERQTWVLVFEESRHPSLYDYHQFLETIDNLYKLIISVAKPEYFRDFWLNGKQIQIPEEDDLRIIEISKHSPDSVVFSGLALILKSIADVFSIGNQYVGIRTANIKVREAEVELEQKELVLTTAKKEAEYKKRIQAEEIYLDLEKKRLEVEKLKNEIEQEKLSMQEKKITQAKASLDMLVSTYKVVTVMPSEMQEVFFNSVFGALETSYGSPYEMIKFAKSQRDVIRDGKP